MRYKISSDVIIKTENAAKPESQSSAFLKSFLVKLPHVSASFDYGCGKLRYSKSMLSITDTLAVVDSEIQLSREQIISGSSTTIRFALRKSNRISVQNTTEFARSTQRFDRAFCINVLSVIPLQLARDNVLELINLKLRSGGTCLFVVQYRNSDFTRMRKMKNSRPWLDGFLVDSLRGFSFYGLISPEKLKTMVSRAGFEVISEDLNEGSVYLLARSTGKKKATQMIIDEGKNFRVSIPK